MNYGPYGDFDGGRASARLVRQRKAFDTSRDGRAGCQDCRRRAATRYQTQQIYTWRRKFAAAQSEPVVSFLPVALIATETSDEAGRPAPTDKPAAKRSTRPVRIEIGCKGGRVLKVEATIAPEVLKALIRSVEEA
jgi:hypothetical protein